MITTNIHNQIILSFGRKIQPNLKNKKKLPTITCIVLYKKY